MNMANALEVGLARHVALRDTPAISERAALTAADMCSFCI